MKYLQNIGTALSQFVGVFFGGDPDESMSSRMGKNLETCWICRFICGLLDIFWPGHCKQAAITDADEGKDEL